MPTAGGPVPGPPAFDSPAYSGASGGGSSGNGSSGNGSSSNGSAGNGSFGNGAPAEGDAGTGGAPARAGSRFAARTADGEPPVTLAEAIGGPRGIVDSAIPTVAFVTVNAEAGLTAGIVVAVAAAAGLVVLRLVRKEPTQQAFSGLFAVAVAAFVASRTGDAEGFFLPSIAKNAVSVVVGVGSVLLGRPLAGYVMAGLDQRYADWRETPALRRAAVWATFVWIAVFGLRFVIQGILYLAGEEGWLAAANIALGLPLFGVAVLATFAIVRRLAPLPTENPEPEPTA